jgi:hypothetical protein
MSAALAAPAITVATPANAITFTLTMTILSVAGLKFGPSRSDHGSECLSGD